MPEQALLKWYFNAAKHEFSPVDQPVYVVAYSYATGFLH
jgi:hypothetical protein